MIFLAPQNTYFFALGNNGNAAGHYEDSDGLFHGVVLENGELRQFDFPGAVQTEIYGISDATGALTGNFTDDSGIRRGFTGDTIVEAPGALETYADFVSAGRLVGSYVDAEGTYHPYARTPAGRFISIDLPGRSNSGIHVLARYQRCRDSRWQIQTGGRYPAHLRRHVPRWATGTDVSG